MAGAAAGIAVCADAVLIPEIPCDLQAGGARLQDKVTARRPWGLVVVAEGRRSSTAERRGGAVLPQASCRRWRRVMPATTSSGAPVRRRRMSPAGCNWRLAEETSARLGPWVRGGAPTAVDRQLALAYGAGAVRAIKAGHYGTIVALRLGREVRALADASTRSERCLATASSSRLPAPWASSWGGNCDEPATSTSAPTRHRPSTSSATAATTAGHPYERVSQGLLAALQVCGNPESIAFKPELSYDPRTCTGKQACGVCLKAPFPEARSTCRGREDDKVRVNWDLAGDCDEALASSARRARSRCSASA